MNDERFDHSNLREEELGKLLRQATPLPELQARARERVREATRSSWQRTVRRRRTRLARLAAGGAGLAVAAGLLFAGLRPTPLPEQVALIEKHVGTVTVAAGSRGEARPVGSLRGALFAGAVVSTGTESGLALRYNQAASLRLGPETIVEAVAPDELRLVAGQLYFDSGARGTHRRLSVLTAWGRVDHVGTQYRVETDGTALLVAVREGRISLTRRSGRHSAMAGRQLEVSADGGVRHTDLPTSDPSWQWAEALATPFAADDRSVAELLKWVARETGRSVTFASPAAQQLASTTILYGQVDASPAQTLELLLATTALEASLELPGRIVVSRRNFNGRRP